MIQCETRLASVLWRFQIKSTLHNLLFTMEFFSNFKKKKKTLKHMLGIWRKDPNGFSRKPSLPDPLVHLPPPLVQLHPSESVSAVRRDWQFTRNWGWGHLFFLEWELHLGMVMVLRDCSPGQSITLLKGNKLQQVVQNRAHLTQPRVLLGEPFQ